MDHIKLVNKVKTDLTLMVWVICVCTPKLVLIRYVLIRKIKDLNNLIDEDVTTIWT